MLEQGLDTPYPFTMDYNINTSNMLRLRYGLDITKPYQMKAVGPAAPKKRLPFQKCCNYIRIQSQDLLQDHSVHYRLSDFVSYTVGSQLPDRDTTDLQPKSLVGNHYPVSAVPILQAWISNTFRYSVRRVSGVRQGETDEPYVIQLKNAQLRKQQPWTIAVMNATNAAHALRIAGERQLTNVQDLAEELIQMGICFRTLSEKQYTQYPRHFPSHTGLEYWALSHHYTVQDYENYLSIKIKLLRFAHARAALLCGGIVWRLSVEHVARANVLYGPSHTFCTGVVAKDGEHKEWVDDFLTDSDADIICGVTRTFTSEYYTLLHRMQILTQA